MAEVTAAAAIFSAVVGVAGQVKQRRDMRKAASRAQDEERKQRAIANRQAALDRQRQIRQTIAQARVTRAQLLQQGWGTGSSSVAGAMSAVGSDVGTAIGNSNTQFASQSAIATSQNIQSGALQDFQRAQGGNFLTGLSQLGSAVGTVAGVWGGGNPFSDGGVVDWTTPLFGRAR